MTHQVKALAVKPDDLSSFPGTNIVEEENLILVSFPLTSHVCYGILGYMHTQTLIIITN